MMAEDKDALICDLAEVYRIYDYHEVPVKTLGILCSGLGPDTRIGMKLTKRYAPRDTIFLAMISDELNYIAWGLLGGGKSNLKPEPMAPSLYETSEKNNKEVVSYDDGESFDKAREELIKRYS